MPEAFRGDVRITEPRLNMEQVFTAPGTWIRPDGVESVEVIVVGGGGGGDASNGVPGPNIPAGLRAGGGGGVRMRYHPVTAPVPVTVGAGGVGTIGTGLPVPAGQPGGFSVFGDAGFGPIASVPPASVLAGGGAGALLNADTTAGGGGGGVPLDAFSQGGPLGYNGQRNTAGGAGSGVRFPNSNSAYSKGIFGMGGGGTAFIGSKGQDGGASESQTARANSGGGGAGRSAPSGASVAPGADGVVIVRWYE